MSHSVRNSRFAVAAVFALIAGSVLHAHTYVGIVNRDDARARVQSPNGSTVDFPVPIPGTDLSVVCFRVRNSSPYDSRITAIGFDVPARCSSFELQRLSRQPELVGPTP